MQTIDTSLAGNLRTLAQLSYAFGVPGAAFVVKYFYDFYGAGVELPAVFYFLPIGVIFLLFSLILAPAVHKSMIPSLNSWITRGVQASQRDPDDPASSSARQWVSILKLVRLLILYSHPCFLILLVASLAQYLAA
jgi:hypothetical protein